MRAGERETAGLKVVAVQSKAEWRQFHHLPFRIYAGDPNWRAPLLLERKFHYSAKHNPFFQHAEAAFWLAYRGAEPVGRISAQVDRLHLQRHADATGFFGSLEAIDDAGVFSALLDTAADWLRGRGMTRARGPITLSMWDQPGLLVEGFDTPPSVLMGHALPYFARHIESAGYVQAQDMLAYDYSVNEPLPPVVTRILERPQVCSDITVRPARMGRADFKAEVALLLDILNDAWSDNWGFVPMTEAEIADLANIFKLLLRPQDVAIAEYRGEAAAFALIFPNINEAARDLGGRLAPFGWAKLLWRLKVARTRTARMPLMGVRKKHQTTPIGAALALSVIAATRGYHNIQGTVGAELSWILEQNEQVKRIIELVGGRAYKRYRLYEAALSAAPPSA